MVHRGDWVPGNDRNGKSTGQVSPAAAPSSAADQASSTKENREDSWVEVTRPEPAFGDQSSLCHVVIDNVQVGVVVLGMSEQRVMTANRQAENTLGKSIGPDDFDDLLELFELSDTPSPGGVCPDQRSLAEIGGRTIGFSSYGIEPGYCCIMFQDITERMRLEAVAESINLAENIGFALSALRHELGNPIASIKMGLIVLKNRLAEFDQEGIRRHVDALLEDVARTESILQSMKSYGMRDDVDLEILDLAQLVREFVERIQDRMASQGIEVTYEGPEALDAVGDSRAMGQVLLNILSNAAAACEGGSGKSIRLQLAKSGGLALLTIADNGSGMSPDQISMAFRPFYTTKRDGSGLGLVISRKLLAKMGGTIDLQSELGQGTTVAIRLPLVPTGEDS